MFELFGSYLHLDKKVYFLSLVRTLNRFGDFVKLLLVLILTEKFGISVEKVGIYSSILILLQFAGSISAGWLSDRFPRKKFLLVVEAGICILYLISGLLLSGGSFPYSVVILILASGYFRGFTWPVTNALVADYSPREQLQESYSLLYLGTNLGVALGPIAAGILFSKSLSLMFICAAVVMAVNFILVLLLLPDDNPHAKKTGRDAGDVDGDRITVAVAASVVFFIIVSMVYSFMYSQIDFILPLDFSDHFGADGGVVYFSRNMSLNAITVLVMTLPLTRMLKGFRQNIQLAISMLFYTLSFLGYAFADNIYLFFLCTFGWTLGEIVNHTSSSTYLNLLIPQSKRGRYNGIFMACQSIGSACGPVFAGLMLSTISFSKTWILLSLLAFGLALVYGFFFGRRKS